MLHNILIKDGLSTPFPKQGKHINVVLASGVILARIHKNNGQVYETSLVSGMALEIKEGYASITFSADTTQQMKIWLSEMPLTYSPSDSRIVGSSAIKSDVVTVKYGSAKELLPAQVGRGKVTINPPEDIKIGGLGVTPSAAITVPANALFEINTQGAIYGYSEDPSNAGFNIIRENNGTFDFIEGTTAIEGDMLTYCEQGNELLVTANGIIKRYDAVTYSLIQFVSIAEFGNFANYANSSNPHLVRFGDDYYTVVSKSDNTSLIKYDSVSKGVTETQLSLTGGDIRDWRIDVFNNRVCALIDVSGTLYFLYGDMVSLSQYEVPDFGAYDAITVGMWGSDFFGIYGLQNKVESHDNGDTFGAVTPIGFNVGYSSGMKRDNETGYIYALTNTNELYRSIDNAATFTQIYNQTTNIYQIWIEGGAIYAVGDKYLAYSMDSGDSFKVINIETVTNNDNLSAFYSLDIASNGVLYIYSYTDGLYRFGGVTELVGGVDVAVMSEVN